MSSTDIYVFYGANFSRYYFKSEWWWQRELRVEASPEVQVEASPEVQVEATP